MNIHNVIKAVGMGIGAATYSLVGNAIGTNHYSRCKILFYSCVITWIIAYSIICPFIVFNKTFIAEIFFSKEEEILMMEQFLMFEMLYFLLNGSYVMYLNYFRAYGFQKKLTLPLLLICIFVGHPLSLFLTFPFGFGLEIYGVWIANLTVRLLVLLSVFFYYPFIDWKFQTNHLFLEVNKN